LDDNIAHYLPRKPHSEEIRALISNIFEPLVEDPLPFTLQTPYQAEALGYCDIPRCALGSIAFWESIRHHSSRPSTALTGRYINQLNFPELVFHHHPLQQVI